MSRVAYEYMLALPLKHVCSPIGGYGREWWVVWRWGLGWSAVFEVWGRFSVVSKALPPKATHMMWSSNHP